MSVTKQTVHKIAKLARIRVEETQLETLSGELNNILDWVEQLSELDTKDVPPMTSVVEIDQVLRKDEVTEGNNAEMITKNAPQSLQNFFVVPKVVE